MGAGIFSNVHGLRGMQWKDSGTSVASIFGAGRKLRVCLTADDVSVVFAPRFIGSGASVTGVSYGLWCS